MKLENDSVQEAECNDLEENIDEEQRAAFEKWKSKTYALTVPLRIVAIRNSVPPAWVKVSFRLRVLEYIFCCHCHDSLLQPREDICL